MTTYLRATPVQFAARFDVAKASHPHGDALGTPNLANLAQSVCYLSGDGLSGYVVNHGDLQSVFSAVKGRGDELVRDAIGNGARTLDCFDGYLPSLYARHGFVEVRREANWTPGGPDVIYMVHAGRAL